MSIVPPPLFWLKVEAGDPGSFLGSAVLRGLVLVLTVLDDVVSGGAEDVVHGKFCRNVSKI